jgi:hypothetical protein
MESTETYGISSGAPGLHRIPLTPQEPLNSSGASVVLKNFWGHREPLDQEALKTSIQCNSRSITFQASRIRIFYYFTDPYLDAK